MCVLRRRVDEAEMRPVLNKRLHLCRRLARVLECTRGARFRKHRFPCAKAAVVGMCENEFRAVSFVCQPSQCLHLIPAIVAAAPVFNLSGIRETAFQEFQVGGVRHR